LAYDRNYTYVSPNSSNHSNSSNGSNVTKRLLASSEYTSAEYPFRDILGAYSFSSLNTDYQFNVKSYEVPDPTVVNKTDTLYRL